MPLHIGVVVNFIVIAALEGFVPEKVDLLEPLLCHVAQAVGLVPAGWKDIKGNLTAYVKSNET